MEFKKFTINYAAILRNLDIYTMSSSRRSINICLFPGDAKEPKDLSAEVKQTLFKICGFTEEEASSRELALVSFLYLFSSLTKEE